MKKIMLDRSTKTRPNRADESGVLQIRRRRQERRSPVTVCIASIFTWHLTDGQTELAVLTASDRMITAADIEYEPSQLKLAFFTSHILGMVAGDYPTHSDAIGIVKARLQHTTGASVKDVADMYGQAISEVRRARAAKDILAPLGLTSESFLLREHEMSPSLVADLVNQLQTHRCENAEALIVGFSEGRGHIYMVDSVGRVSCYNDVNFAAIGLGGWHAQSQLMLSKYGTRFGFADSLVALYRAKKGAEVAPGVGSQTDMFLINHDGASPVAPNNMAALDAQFESYRTARDKLVQDGVKDLIEHVGKQK